MVLVFGEYSVAKIIEMLSEEEKAKVQKVLDAVKEKARKKETWQDYYAKSEEQKKKLEKKKTGKRSIQYQRNIIRTKKISEIYQQAQCTPRDYQCSPQ